MCACTLRSIAKYIPVTILKEKVANQVRKKKRWQGADKLTTTKWL